MLPEQAQAIRDIRPGILPGDRIENIAKAIRKIILGECDFYLP